MLSSFRDRHQRDRATAACRNHAASPITSLRFPVNLLIICFSSTSFVHADVVAVALGVAQLQSLGRSFSILRSPKDGVRHIPAGLGSSIRLSSTTSKFVFPSSELFRSMLFKKTPRARFAVFPRVIQVTVLFHLTINMKFTASIFCVFLY